jgi:hypothetical protein
VKAVPVSAVLRNKQSCVRLRPSGPVAEADAAEDHWFRLTANDVCAVEESFGTYAALNESFKAQPIVTIRRVLALAVLHCTEDEAGARMLSEHTDAYWASIEGAFAIALGSTEEAAGKAVRARLELSAAAENAQNAAWDAMFAELAKGSSPQALPSSSKRGSKQAEKRASSGT